METGGDWPGTADRCSGSDWTLGSVWWAIALCTTCFSWVFFSLSLFVNTLFITIIIILYFIALTKLFLFQPTSFTFFLILLLIPPSRGGVSKQLCGAELPTGVKPQRCPCLLQPHGTITRSLQAYLLSFLYTVWFFFLVHTCKVTVFCDSSYTPRHFRLVATADLPSLNSPLKNK